MQRRNVDLPEPEGPITTATSPAFTARSMPLSTSRWPNDLCTASARTISPESPPLAGPGSVSTRSTGSVLMDHPSDDARIDQRWRGTPAGPRPVPPGEVPLDVELRHHQDTAQE